MKVKMTSGKEFDIDFNTEAGYQEMRDMFFHLKSKGFFKEVQNDDERLEDMIDTLVPSFPTVGKDVIEMVSKHYLNQLNQRKEWGEIDEVDLAIQLGKLVVLELEQRWK
jgi:hypothetical protein